MEPEKESFCQQPCVKIIQSANKRNVNFPVANRGPVTGYWKRFLSIPSLGIVLGILSSFSFSVALMLVKVINGVDPMFFVMCRGVLQFFLFNTVTIYQAPALDVLKNKRIVGYLVLTGVFGSSAQVLAYGCLTFIPLADATAIILSAPVFVSFFACVLLKEKCGVFQVMTVAIAVIGVLLVCKPTFIFGSSDEEQGSTMDHLSGTIMAAVGCLSMAAVYITFRKIVTVPTAISNSTLALFSIVIGLSSFMFNGKWHLPHCGLEALLLVTSAIMGTLGMLLFVIATKVEEAGPLSVARTSEIVFAFIWQMGLLGELPSWTTLAGAGAVVSSVMLTAMHKWNSQNVACLGLDCCHFDRKREPRHSNQNEIPPREPVRFNADVMPSKEPVLQDESRC